MNAGTTSVRSGVARVLDVIDVDGSFNGDGGPPGRSVDLDGFPHDSVAGVVIRAVAEYTGTPAVELDPLTESVDSDALEALVGSGAGDGPAGPATVSFRYAGLIVTASTDGRLRLTPADAGRVDELLLDSPDGGWQGR